MVGLQCAPAVYLELELHNCLRSKWIPTPISKGSQAQHLAPCCGTLRVEHVFTIAQFKMPDIWALMTVGVSNSRPLSTEACELVVPDEGMKGLGSQWPVLPGPLPLPLGPPGLSWYLLPFLYTVIRVCGLRAETGGVTERTAFTGLLISRPV